jgi:HK97 gp10 family phage protein
MPAMKVKVEGLRELEQALAALGKVTGKAVLRRVAKERLKPLESAAKSLAPVEEGNLRESITTGTRLTRRQAALAKKATKSTVEMHMGTSHQAAVPQEFGTYFHGAQPFMRPTWDANKMSLLDGIAEDLGTEIDKAAARKARKAARLAAKG